MLGTPYMFQQSAPGVGMDCGGLLRAVSDRLGCGLRGEFYSKASLTLEFVLAELRREMVEMSTPALGSVRLSLEARGRQPHVGIIVTQSTAIEARSDIPAIVREVVLGAGDDPLSGVSFFGFPGVLY